MWPDNEGATTMQNALDTAIANLPAMDDQTERAPLLLSDQTEGNTEGQKADAEGGEDETDDEEDADIDADIARKNSVVGTKYKIKYKERAASRVNIAKPLRKAAKRSTWDWLAETLAKHTLDEKLKLKVEAFELILDANGVKHDHWNRTTPGWQGRLRMTGRLALQRVVAESGELAMPDGETIPAPKAWIAKHQH